MPKNIEVSQFPDFENTKVLGVWKFLNNFKTFLPIFYCQDHKNRIWPRLQGCYVLGIIFFFLEKAAIRKYSPRNHNYRKLKEARYIRLHAHKYLQSLIFYAKHFPPPCDPQLRPQSVKAQYHQSITTLSVFTQKLLVLVAFVSVRHIHILHSLLDVRFAQSE